MKNVFVTNKQMNFICEALEDITPKNGVVLLQNARQDGFDILDDRAVERALKKRYNAILSYFNDDVSNISADKVQNKMNTLMERCKRLEEPIKEQLSKLCLNTMVTMFDMPDGVFNLSCSIVEDIDPNKQFHIKPDTNEDYEYEDYDTIKSEDSEVRKRKIINCLIAGGALKLMKKAQDIYMPELFELNEELPHLYSKIMKLNELLLFLYSIDINDKEHHQCGTTTVKLNPSGEQSSVECEGVLFPFLMYETIKGVLELLASQGLPKDLDKAQMVINKSDILQLDPTNMRVGPYIWHLIFRETDIKTIPNVFHHIVKLKSDKIEDIFNNICFETRFGYKIIDELNKTGKHDFDYESFKDDILKRQDDNEIITDSYFLAEELDLGSKEHAIMKLIECDPSEIEFGVEDIFSNLPFMSKSKRSEYQLYPTINGIELGPEDGINLRAEEVYINGEQKYQLHIYIEPELRRNGIASKLYEAFILQGYPVCSLLSNRTSQFNKENGVEKEGDDAIGGMWKKLAEKGYNIRNINGDENIGVETF